MAISATEQLNPICIGCDIGQLHDPTAISVAEVKQVHTGKYHYARDITLGHHEKGQWVPDKGIDPVMLTEYTIRNIRRLPLGTSYPDVAVIIAEMLCSPLFRGRKIRVLMDVTGVGRPVYDDLRKEIKLREEAKDTWLKPVTFSHGEHYNRTTGLLGKAYLVSRLQALLQGGRVHAPDTPEVRATLEELKVYEIKVTDNGKDTYGAIIGKHDDLATALALSCLEDPYGERITYSQRVY